MSESTNNSDIASDELERNEEQNKSSSALGPNDLKEGIQFYSLQDTLKTIKIGKIKIGCP